MIVVKDRRFLFGCKPLGRVEAQSAQIGNLALMSMASESTENKMYNGAAKLGGDTIFITRKKDTLVESDFEAEVYKCKGFRDIERVQRTPPNNEGSIPLPAPVP